MLKLLLPTIMLSVTFFVTCLFLAFGIRFLNSLLNLNKLFKSENNYNSDCERVVPALKF